MLLRFSNPLSTIFKPALLLCLTQTISIFSSSLTSHVLQICNTENIYYVSCLYKYGLSPIHSQLRIFYSIQLSRAYTYPCIHYC